MQRRSCFLATAVLTFAAPSLPAQSASGDSGPLGIAVERRLAVAAHLHVGDTLRVAAPGDSIGRAARVEAIYVPRADPSTVVRRDNRIRLHVPDLAALLGQPDRVDRFAIVLRSGVNPDSAASELGRNAFGYDVMTSRSVAATSSTTFLVVSRFHRAIAFISVLASTVFLLCLMLLKVEERRRDVAMMRFIGISRRTVFTALLLEAALLALFGSLIGSAIAAVAGAVVNAYYQHAYQTALIFSELTLSTVLFAVALSVGLGLGAGALAAWRIVRIPPVELWSRAA